MTIQTTKGIKYECSRDMTEIAKLVRKDIKAEFPGVKVSVRKSGYSSLDICIKSFPENILNKQRIKHQEENPNDTDHYGFGHPFGGRYTTEAQAARDKIQGIAKSYTYSTFDDDPGADYPSGGQFVSVDFDYDLEQEHKEAVLKELEETPEKVESEIKLEQEKKEKIDEIESKLWDIRQQKKKLETEEEALKAEIEEIKNGPIELDRIVIHWSESSAIGENVEVSSIDEANGLLFQISSANKSDGGYDKTKITLYWKDGQEYEGRWDVKHFSKGSILECDYEIKGHILAFCKYSIENPRPGSDNSFLQAILDGRYALE